MRKGLYLLLLVPVLGFAALSKTFPTSAVTTVRLSAYDDALGTIWKTTQTVKMDSWEVLDSSYTWIPSNQEVVVYRYDLDFSTMVPQAFVFDLQNYTELVYREALLRGINEVLDDSIEQYIVYPGTVPPHGWKGFCSNNVNGKVVPIFCP